MLDPKSPIIVLGAGIIGLTAAVRLLSSPLQTNPIHIIADHLPNDPLDAKYASTIAGAHHLSFAANDDARQQGWDRETFRVMYEEWKNQGEVTGLRVIKQTEYYVGTKEHLKIYEEHPDFAIHEVEGSPLKEDHRISFTSLTMHPQTYLNRLLTLLKGRCQIHRYHLPSLGRLAHPSITSFIGPTPPYAVFVCTGLGSISLGGVDDTTVYPTRGQIVKIHAPWVQGGYTRQIGDLGGREGGERTYVIPRTGGEVILGGTRDDGDWYPYPREETTRDILKRAMEICPELIQGQEPGEGSEVGEKNLEVLANLVGFRPTRRDGTRLEMGDDLELGLEVGERKTKVVYNYGHGGAGWQSCWGCADAAVELLVRTKHAETACEVTISPVDQHTYDTML